MSPRRVFITGGAGGLGRALAERWVRAGASVCIGDRDEAACADTLAALTPLARGEARVHALRCDVTREEDLREAARWLAERWGGVDVVVNNAGVAQMGAIDATPLADWSWILDVNLLGVVRSCRAFVPVLRAQGGGTLVNVASMAALICLPEAGAYSATKAAVVALSEALELELERDRIRVVVACPSFFRSDLARHMRAADPDAARMTRRLVERARVSAEDVARQIHEGVERGETRILTHPEARSAWRLKRWLPHRLYLGLLRRQLAGLRARRDREVRA